ncbi:hypothetical protein [Promicromonospora soli]
MTGIRPTAIAYVSGPAAALEHQRDAATHYARAEGLALERFIDDVPDEVTISQLVEAALACGVRVVLIPAGARMAAVQERVMHDLEPHGAVCIVIDQSRATAPQHARLANYLPRQRQGALA